MEDSFAWANPVHDRFKFEWNDWETFDLAVPDAAECDVWRRLEDVKEPEVVQKEQEQIPANVSIEEKRVL